MIGIIYAKSSEKIALFYSLAGMFLSMTLFMSGMTLAGAVAMFSAAGGGVAVMLFGGAADER